MSIHSQYKLAKRKRVVDPLAPPRPNLLSQVKELRVAKEGLSDAEKKVDLLSHMLNRQHSEIERLRSKLMRLENTVSLLIQKVNSK